MLTRDQDFVCDTSKGIVLCSPLTPEAESAYKVLQLALARLVAQIPGVRTKIDVDGVIGPTVALATQMVFTRMSQGHPEVARELGALIYAPAEQAILGVAEHADALAGYIDKIITDDPNAVRSPKPPPAPAPEDPVKFLKRIFTKKRLLAGAATLAGFAGLAVVATASSARALGRVDRSGFLPASDGTDETDDDDEDDGGYEDVIDAEVIESHEPKRLALPSPEA